MRNTISILVSNEPGELSRILNLFSARGYNIESISVGKTLEPNLSRCTIVTKGDNAVVQQILKQCSRLVRVREAKAVTRLPHIEREMALIDVTANQPRDRQEILNLVSVFRAKVVDITNDRFIIETSGNEEKVERFIKLLHGFGIVDITRTGSVAINRLPEEGETELAASA
ncbi:MAG: acetolactate synthase small subunit [Pyrinomonadaceae bacterium]